MITHQHYGYKLPTGQIALFYPTPLYELLDLNNHEWVVLIRVPVQHEPVWIGVIVLNLN